MDKKQLYEKITERKIKPKDFEPYDGNNGRVNKCVQLFRKGILKTGGTLVDVGGGIGDLGHSLHDAFDRCICLDISKENLKAASAKGNECYITDLDRDGLAGDRIKCTGTDLLYNYIIDDVDVITAPDIIEHLIDPEFFARECFRALKPGGQVFINTPNIQLWRHIETLLFTDNFPHTSGDREVFHGGHLSFFSFGDLRDIFGAAGFNGFEQIKDEEGYEEPPNWLINEFITRTGGPKTQQGFVQMKMKFGCPNMLFKCEKP